MSSYHLETYSDSTLPEKYHEEVLRLGAELIEYEQGLSVGLIGKRREVASAATLAQFLVKDSVITLAVMNSGDVELAGICTFYHESVLGRLVIDTVYVDLEYRLLGIAKEMLAVPLRSNYSTVDVSVMANNEPARKLYASLGFEPYITMMTKVN